MNVAIHRVPPISKTTKDMIEFRYQALLAATAKVAAQQVPVEKVEKKDTAPS